MIDLPNEQLRHDRMRVRSKNLIFFWLTHSQSQDSHTKHASVDGTQARNSLLNTETLMIYMDGGQEQGILGIAEAV